MFHFRAKGLQMMTRENKDKGKKNKIRFHLFLLRFPPVLDGIYFRHGELMMVTSLTDGGAGGLKLGCH